MAKEGLFSGWYKTAMAYQQGLQSRIRAEAQRTINNHEAVKANGVLNEILQKNLVRSVVQMDTWRLGLNSWEDHYSPDRSWLYQIYNEIVLDGQVQAKMNVAANKVAASEFQLVDPVSNEENEKLTNLFKSEWFDKFLREAISSDYFGYTMFQFPEMDKPFHFDANDLRIVPRHLVLPNVNVKGKRDILILPQAGARSGVSAKRGKYSHRLVGIGDEEAFGLFAAVAPLFIYKKNAMSFWSGYQQRYGEPTMSITMNTWNDDTHKEYQRFLRNRGTNSGLILRNEDTAQMLEANRHDAFNIYQEMLKYCDGGISKIMEGNTGTSDTGGSKSTSETHAVVANVFHLGRLKKLAYAINDRLIPFLETEYGWSFEGNVFRWKEFKDIDANVENITKLSANYEISNDEIKKHTGFIVEGIKEDVDQRQSNRKTGNDPDDKTSKRRD